MIRIFQIDDASEDFVAKQIHKTTIFFRNISILMLIIGAIIMHPTNREILIFAIVSYGLVMSGFFWGFHKSNKVNGSIIHKMTIDGEDVEFRTYKTATTSELLVSTDRRSCKLNKGIEEANNPKQNLFDIESTYTLTVFAGSKSRNYYLISAHWAEWKEIEIFFSQDDQKVLAS